MLGGKYSQKPPATDPMPKAQPKVVYVADLPAQLQIMCWNSINCYRSLLPWLASASFAAGRAKARAVLTQLDWKITTPWSGHCSGAEKDCRLARLSRQMTRHQRPARDVYISGRTDAGFALGTFDGD